MYLFKYIACGFLGAHIYYMSIGLMLGASTETWEYLVLFLGFLIVAINFKQSETGVKNDNAKTKIN